jgi:ubiquinol-cytochrome c reductase cytochrome b subunit
VTGIVLAMHYTPQRRRGLRFGRAHHARRQLGLADALCARQRRLDVLLRGLSIHIFRGFYLRSYKAPREMVWLLGVVIFLLMMATAFMGYVLPWGQMSFWGAKVITGLFSAIPLVGEPIQSGCWADSRPTTPR